MNTISNKLLAALALLLILSGGYVYFSQNLDVSAADSSSSLVSTSGNLPTAGALGNTKSAKISEDTAFLYTLTSLTRIKIDTSLFTDPSFSALTDNTVVLEPAVAGRPNPFAPIDRGVPLANAPIALVVTNQPDQITAKSALLNGTTNNTPGVTSVYFEYGPTATLGKVTPVAKQSLIGSFGANITGLVHSTTYFYRAVAKINNTLFYGDIVSFNTN
jgi:hypothetical protein